MAFNSMAKNCFFFLFFLILQPNIQLTCIFTVELITQKNEKNYTKERKKKTCFQKKTDKQFVHSREQMEEMLSK